MVVDFCNRTILLDIEIIIVIEIVYHVGHLLTLWGPVTIKRVFIS